MLIFVLILVSLEFVLPEGNILQPQPPQQQPMPKAAAGPKTPLSGSSSSSTFSLPDFYSPFNVTVSHLSPRSIEISWSCKDNTLNDRYEVTIKPVLASYKVVETVPNNMCFLLMDKLEPDTAYQVAVTSVSGRTRKRSGYVMFRTFMEDDYQYTEFTEDDGVTQEMFDGSLMSSSSGDPSSEDAKGRIRLPRVRLVEISLVGMALVLWAGAIVLFFHRWGKIRMLLPYQPDYKEMKNSNASCTTCSITPHHQCQKLHHLPASELYPSHGVAGALAFHHHNLLPHQPLSEPGPSESSCHGGHNMVTVTEAGCSPIRPNNMPSFTNEGDISIDMSLHRHHHHLTSIHRKAKSAEQLKQYVCPWEEQAELECTEF